MCLRRRCPRRARGRSNCLMFKKLGHLHALARFLRFQEAGGGKLHVFAAALPKAGAGALKPRRAEGGGGAEPLTIMVPEGSFYKKLAIDAAEHQVQSQGSFNESVSCKYSMHCSDARVTLRVSHEGRQADLRRLCCSL